MSEQATPSIVEEVVSSTAVVRFNRPAQKNSLSSDFLNSFDAVLTKLSNNSNLKAIVFTGTNDVFLSGAHIGELSTLDQANAAAFSHNGQKLMQRIANARQITIAAINGYCIGGGLDFALACDIRVASRNAIFAHPGARLGIITGWGGTQRLARIIGRSRALELFLTTRQISSSEALRMGLVSLIDDPVVECALKMVN